MRYYYDTSQSHRPNGHDEGDDTSENYTRILFAYLSRCGVGRSALEADVAEVPEGGSSSRVNGSVL